MWKNFKFEGWPGGNRNHGDQKLEGECAMFISSGVA